MSTDEEIVGAYDPQMAWILAIAVNGAYYKYSNPDWTIKIGNYNIDHGNYIYAFEAGEGGSQFFGFTAWGSYTGQPPFHNIVAVRGTVSTEEGYFDLKDWTLMDCVLPYDGGNTYGQACTGLYDFYSDDDGGLVTSFADSFKGAISNLNPNYPTCYIAAHSLGGGLVTLGALDAVVSGSFPLSGTRPKVYTYGGLYTGDQTFVNQFANNQINDFYRLVNLADWVPTLRGPLADTPGYVHVGTEYAFLWQQGGYWANHSLMDTYWTTLTKHPQAVKTGARKYPNTGSS